MEYDLPISLLHRATCKDTVESLSPAKSMPRVGSSAVSPAKSMPRVARSDGSPGRRPTALDADEGRVPRTIQAQPRATAR